MLLTSTKAEGLPVCVSFQVKGTDTVFMVAANAGILEIVPTHVKIEAPIRSCLIAPGIFITLSIVFSLKELSSTVIAFSCRVAVFAFSYLLNTTLQPSGSVEGYLLFRVSN